MSNTPFYTKTETDYKVQDAKSQAYLGIATTTTTPPATGAYWYRVDTAGTYTNFLSGGSPVVVSVGDLDGNDVIIEVKDNVATKRVKNILLNDENYVKKINNIALAADLNVGNFPAEAANVANIYINQFETFDDIMKVNSISILGKGVISIYKAKSDNTEIKFIKDIDLGDVVENHTVQITDLYLNPGERIGIGGKVSGTSVFYFKSPAYELNAYESPANTISPLSVAYSYQLRNLSYSEFSNLKNEDVELKPIESFSTIEQSLSNRNIFYGNHYQTFPTNKIVKEITFKGSGDIDIYSVNADYSERNFIKTIYLGASNETHVIPTNFTLEAGKRLIFNASSGTFYFDIPNAGEVEGYASDSTNYPINTLFFAFSYKVREYSVSDLAELIFSENSIEIVEDAISTSIYKTDFEVTNNWILNGWELSNGVAKNLQNGINNNLHLPFIYNCNKRRAKFRVKPSIDTDFRIHLKGNYNTESEGGSLFGINFATKKIQIFKVLTSWESPNITSSGVDVDNVLVEKSFNFINGREYSIELKYYKTKHTLTITDMVSAEKTELTFDGWAGGRQQQQYSFWVNSGGQVEIRDFEIFAVDDVETLFVGDSITEGVMVVDKSKRWWELMTPYLKGVTAVSARGGHTTSDVLAKFDNELKLLKPKRIIFLIGVNNGASPESHYTDILNLCNANNIKAYFCYLTALSDTSSYNAMMGRILSVVPTENIGFRFDLATTVNNDGQTINSALFYDNLHPIESGCAEMAKRIFADIDILK